MKCDGMNPGLGNESGAESEERQNLGDSYWEVVEFRSRVLPVISVLV